MKVLAQQPVPQFEDIEDIIDISSSEEIPAPEENLSLKDEPLSPFLVISIIGGFLILCFLALLVLSRKKKHISTPKEKSLEPYEQAINDLRLIWDQADSLNDKPYASSIADTLRLYIESEFSIRAPEYTTQEFLEVAKHNDDLKGEFSDTLQEFLELIDLVKFAKMPLSTEQRSEIYNTAVQFVEESHQSLSLKIDPELSMSQQVQKND